MKVINVSLCGPYTEGLSYQDNLLPKYQKELGYDVTIITSQWTWGADGALGITKKTDGFNEDGIRVIRLAIKNNHAFNHKFKRYAGLYDAVEEISPDILFIHGCQFLDIDTLVLYARRHPSVKIFVDNHADFSNSARNAVSRLVLHGIIWRHYARLIAPHTAKFFGVMPSRVDFLVDIYGLPREKCELLVMGADDDMVEHASDGTVSEKVRKKLNIRMSDFVIVTGGKIDRWKRQTLHLMDAFSLLGDSGTRLVVFGPVTDDLKDGFEKRLLNPNIIYLPWMDTKEAYELFLASDLAVFPGRHSVYWEEAAGCGLPMVVKEWKGTRHVDVGGNVFFLQSGSASEILDAINRITSDIELYDGMRKSAREKAVKYFSYRRIAKQSLGME